MYCGPICRCRMTGKIVLFAASLLLCCWPGACGHNKVSDMTSMVCTIVVHCNRVREKDVPFFQLVFSGLESCCRWRATKGQKSHPLQLAWLTKVIILIKRCLKLMMAGHRGSLFLLCMHSAVIVYTKHTFSENGEWTIKPWARWTEVPLQLVVYLLH